MRQRAERLLEHPCKCVLERARTCYCKQRWPRQGTRANRSGAECYGTEKRQGAGPTSCDSSTYLLETRRVTRRVVDIVIGVLRQLEHGLFIHLPHQLCRASDDE